MGIWDGLMNIFKNSNAATSPTHSTASVMSGNAAQSAHQAVPPQNSVAKKSAESSSAGGANWFNGIGNTSGARQGGSLTVYSLKETPMCLSSSDFITSGGEGTVYALPGKPHVLVKIYRDDLLRNPVKRAEIEKRIYDMLAISRDIDQSSFAWPRAAVFNSRKQVIGFAMNKCGGTPRLMQGMLLLVEVCHEQVRRDLFPGAQRR